MIEISLKFEKTHDKDDANSICNNSIDKNNFNFLELSHKTLNDVCSNVQVHQCVSDLLQHMLINKPLVEPPNTSQHVDTSKTLQPTTNVIVHQSDLDVLDNTKIDSSIIKRNSSQRSSMKSSHSMETILEKSAARLKEKSPDDSKAKSVSHLNDEDEGDEYIENGESIELIFISDEFVNKVQKQDQVIVLDEKNGKRRESLTGNKKIVIITDEYKQKVLRNNSIVLTNETKMLKKKLKRAKTYNTYSNSYLPYDEEESFEKVMENKKLSNRPIN